MPIYLHVNNNQFGSYCNSQFVNIHFVHLYLGFRHVFGLPNSESVHLWIVNGAYAGNIDNTIWHLTISTLSNSDCPMWISCIVCNNLIKKTHSTSAECQIASHRRSTNHNLWGENRVSFSCTHTWHQQCKQKIALSMTFVANQTTTLIVKVILWPCIYVFYINSSTLCHSDTENC